MASLRGWIALLILVSTTVLYFYVAVENVYIVHEVRFLVAMLYREP